MSSERNADSRVKAQKVLQKSVQQGRNEFTIDYDEMNPFRLPFIEYIFFGAWKLFFNAPCLQCEY